MFASGLVRDGWLIIKAAKSDSVNALGRPHKSLVVASQLRGTAQQRGLACKRKQTMQRSGNTAGGERRDHDSRARVVARTRQRGEAVRVDTDGGLVYIAIPQSSGG